MNIACCITCGEDFANQSNFSPDNQHFYHKACFYDRDASDFIEDCIACIRLCYSSSTSEENCRKCQKKLEICHRAFSLCNKCGSEKLPQDFCIYCRLCKCEHYFKYTTCAQCENYIIENDQNPDIFYYYCKTCTVSKQCRHCNQFIEFGDFVCGNDHAYHIHCFKKRPVDMRNCNKCLDFYSALMVRYIENNIEGKKCSLCNVYRDVESNCMNNNFYCNNCRDLVQFTEVQIDCFCEECESTKNFIVEQRKNLIQCTYCKRINFKGFVSTCGKVTICVDCTNMVHYPNLIFLMLRGCDCSKCRIDQLNGLKACSICLVIEFNDRSSLCENENFYCENCTNFHYQDIFRICTCNFCLDTILALMKINGTHKLCLNCKKVPIQENGCKIFQFCCNDCWISEKKEIQCTCGNHSSQIMQKKSILLPLSVSAKCMNCKRTSNFAVTCNHNQCYLCFFKKSLRKFFEFIENYSNRNVKKISKSFDFQCCVEGCKNAFDMSSSFCFKSLGYIFTKEQKEMLNCFLPYFDGIEFEFEVCRCGKVVGFNEEVRLGCGCLKY